MDARLFCLWFPHSDPLPSRCWGQGLSAMRSLTPTHCYPPAVRPSSGWFAFPSASGGVQGTALACGCASGRLQVRAACGAFWTTRPTPRQGGCTTCPARSFPFPRPAHPASCDQPGCHPYPVRRRLRSLDVTPAERLSVSRSGCLVDGCGFSLPRFSPSGGSPSPVSRHAPILGGFPGCVVFVLFPGTGCGFVPGGLTARPRCQTLCPPPSGGAVPWSTGCPPRGPRLTR